MSSIALAFAPDLGAHVISEDEVVLLAERDRFALTGRVHAALAPLLDGSRSEDDIVSELAPEHSPARVRLALIRLRERGHVVEASEARARRSANQIAAAAPPVSASEPTSARPPLTAAPHALREVAVAGLPASWARQLEGMFGGPGGAERSRPGLTVCLLDDYLRPELAVSVGACLARDEALFPVRPVGRWLWFGPLFAGPGGAPAWELFDARLRMNRVADVAALERGARLPLFPDDRSPATVGLALSIAAELVTACLAGAPPPAVIDAMLTYDALSERFEHHALTRIGPPRADPAPQFGQRLASLKLRPARRRFDGDGGHRVCPPSETLVRLERFVSPITGIVSAVEPGEGVGGMRVFSAVHVQAPAAARPQRGRLGRKGGANGKGFREDQARASCLGEAIERYSGGFFGDEPVRHARHGEIAEIALHPEELLLFSDAQYAAPREQRDAEAADAVPARFDASQTVGWAPAGSLITGETRWLPAAFCYYGYGTSEARGHRGAPYCVADSNGCASGNTVEEAILQGLLELLERDACALAWYSCARRPEIQLEGFPGQPFAPVREAFAARGRELHVLDLRADTKVPVALAVACNRADGLATRFALGCHLDPRIAVSRSLSELAQLEPPEGGSPAGDEPFASASIRQQPNLLPSGDPPLGPAELPNLIKADIGEELEWCCRMLAGLGHDVLVLDQTRPEVGVPTVRVVVPGLRHFWRRLAPGRLYDVPVALGWVRRPLTEDELNPLSVLI